ncbi:MAG: 2-amino-4-hydroxy-6-hydroxymethyldihydropteridine diphosphokinase [Actinobacteria bacterium]|nr:MAG: 2-amino-4-hydroxy-6-hydroxymethyldihydropteridine diphosphokinase [Actinomycetota bacterium]
MTRAVLALGSNLGDRFGQLKAAVRALSDVLLVVSGVYETPPWGDPDQPPYLNAAVLVADERDDPGEWLTRVRSLESGANRARDPDRRYGPRTLDVDVITVTGSDGAPVVSADPDLTLPHPRAHLRAFVLRPWLDIEPYAQLPGHGWVTDLMRTPAVAADLPGLTPRPDLVLEPYE